MTKRSRFVAICLAVAALSFAVSCSGNEKPSTTHTPPPGLPPGGPPAWPHVFQGSATVAGEPIAAGVSIFARLGSARSLVAETLEGRYLNIIVGPTVVEDLDSKITFYLGHPDGPTVKAKETFEFKSRSEITNFNLDLSFPKLP